MNEPTSSTLVPNFLEQLETLLGTENVLSDEASRRFYSTDVYREAKVLAAVVARPADVDQLQELVKLCGQNLAPMVVRGGGASYTDGYLPVQEGTVSIDTSRMKLIEINADDMFVTVDAGVTWEEMNTALKKQGLRTPMWGPFSGLAATVAGSMSHYAVNYGSGTYGISAETLTGMDVVLASGELLSTGSGGGVNANAFYRYYGPDLTGLFVGEAGALGVKARLSLRLIKRPLGFAAASFGFPDGESALSAMIEIARLGVVAQCFGLDPRQQKTALTRMESANPFEAVKSVFLSAKNPLDGVLQVARMGLAGRNFLKKANYSAHFSCEGVSDAEAKAKLAAVRVIGRRYGAEVANSIPTYFNAEPFMPLLPILGPNGELWKPTHGVLPFSKVIKHHREFEALKDEYRDRMQKHRVQLTRMLMAYSTNAFIYEPTFLWEDARSVYHEREYPAEFLASMPVHPDNPEGRALVKELKGRIQELCTQNGAIHMQIGKDYPYLQTRKPATAALVKDLKQTLDPNGLMNPGALGL